MSDYMYTTRQGVACALASQRVNGLGVRTVGWTIFRPHPGTWKAIRTGYSEGNDQYFNSISDVLNFLFTKVAA